MFVWTERLTQRGSQARMEERGTIDGQRSVTEKGKERSDVYPIMAPISVALAGASVFSMLLSSSPFLPA
jgi:hypothetical protein